MSAQDIILTGKHKGSSFAEAFEKNDKHYCHWLLHATSLPRSLLPFRRWIQRTHGGILLVGKHRNSTYARIVDEFPDYAVWASTLESPSALMRDFQMFLVERAANGEAAQQPPAATRPTGTAQQTPAAKRARGPVPEASSPPSWECKVCFDARISALFMPCRHLVCCMPCANLSERCPVCREAISERMRVFAG